MKKQWKKPLLEVLDVKMTMASTHNGPVVDEAYVEGVRSEDPRFTS